MRDRDNFFPEEAETNTLIIYDKEMDEIDVEYVDLSPEEMIPYIKELEQQNPKCEYYIMNGVLSENTAKEVLLRVNSAAERHKREAFIRKVIVKNCKAIRIHGHHSN